MGIRGVKTSPVLKQTLIDTLLFLHTNGKKGRDTATPRIRDIVDNKHPEWIEDMPELQTINKMLKPIRKRLPTKENPIDQEWSIGSWHKNHNEVSKETLNILISMMSKNFIQDTTYQPIISIREVKWLETIITTLGDAYHNWGNWIFEDQEFKETNEDFYNKIKPITNAVALLKLAKAYANRERVNELTQDSINTRDLDQMLIHKSECSTENKSTYELFIYTNDISLPDFSEERKIFDKQMDLDKQTDTNESYNYEVFEPLILSNDDLKNEQEISKKAAKRAIDTFFSKLRDHIIELKRIKKAPIIYMLNKREFPIAFSMLKEARSVLLPFLAEIPLHNKVGEVRRNKIRKLLWGIANKIGTRETIELAPFALSTKLTPPAAYS